MSYSFKRVVRKQNIFYKSWHNTLLIGTDVKTEQSVLDIIKKVCDENDVESDNESKANVFVMDLEDFKKF